MVILLILAGGHVLRVDGEDAVRVDVEGDLDLRHAARRGRMPVEVEAAERAVVARLGALALEHVDLDGGLAVGRGARRSPSSCVGMVVLRGIIGVITPPSVSTPSESGVTSRSTMSFTSPESTPAWTAAPMATTSSGFTPCCGSLPKKLLDVSCTIGMRVEPPTRTTSSISFGLLLRVGQAFLVGSSVRWTRSSHHLLELRAA